MLNNLANTINHAYHKNDKLSGALRYLKWQIKCRLNPNGFEYQFTENTKLHLQKGIHGSDANYYNGLAEFDDMSFLLHFLRPEDLFIDIGANVGVYSILASAEVGAKSVSFEPIPSTFSNFKKNISINKCSNIEAKNMALGAKTGILKFTKNLDSENHVATNAESDTISVDVEFLDNVLEKSQPNLLKIDVEGFETEVLNGADSTLKLDSLKAIIIELNGSGERYGYDETKIHNKFLDLDFLPYNYDPYTRSLISLNNFGSHNTIYVRDYEFVINRLKNSKSYHIGYKNLIL